MGSTAWPELLLTDDERQFVRTYPDATHPGVLPRVYPLAPLVDSTIAADDRRFVTRFIPSRRRTRVHTITFSGDVGVWAVSIRTGSGELLSELAPVTALLNGPQLSPAAFAPDWTAAVDLLARVQPGLLVFDPNIVMSGSDVLIFDGIAAPGLLGEDNRTILNIACHVWEFPGMEEAARLANAKRGP